VPPVSVVVPVHNGADALPALLAALAGQTGVADVEVVVVDNRSTDRTAEVARASSVVAQVVSEARPGSYVARNAGWRACQGEVVAFTDVDCRPEPGWLAALVEAVDRGADLAGGAIVPGPPPPGTWARWWAGYDRVMYLDQADNVRENGFAATANLAVRRTVLEALDGFDDALASGGDAFFGRRAVAAGHRLVWVPEAVVLHQPRAGLRATWALWRRLGRGYGDLATRGEWPVPLRRDPVLRKPLKAVLVRATERDVRTPRPVLAATHAVARAAVLRGRLDAR
jgi:glycosyltransferase involved in cell wall biosynthesis